MRTARTIRHALCVLVVPLLAGTLAACGGGDESGTAGDARPPAPAAKEGANPRNNTSASGGDTAGGDTAGGENRDRPNLEPISVPAGRSVVYTAELRVRAPDVQKAAAEAKRMAGAAGGYVANETSGTEPARARLTLKIPADRFPTVLDGLATELGEKVSLRQEAEDVTGEVADVDSRVRSAEAALASFRKLLDRADTVGEVINVEEKIAQRQSDLEALQARQKALRESTRYATVTVTLRTPDGEDRNEDEGSEGFLGGLKSGWEDFTAFLSGSLLVVGWLLPFLALAAVIGVPAYFIWRRWWRRTARTGTAAPVPSPAESE